MAAYLHASTCIFGDQQLGIAQLGNEEELGQILLLLNPWMTDNGNVHQTLRCFCIFVYISNSVWELIHL